MATRPVFDQAFGRVPERATLELGGTLRNKAGRIAGSALATCTLTIYDVVTGVVAAGYDHLDVKASVSSVVGLEGDLSLTVAPVGSWIQNAARPEEEKVALLEFSYNNGAAAGYCRYRFTVVNEPKRS